MVPPRALKLPILPKSLYGRRRPGGNLLTTPNSLAQQVNYSAPRQRNARGVNNSVFFHSSFASRRPLNYSFSSSFLFFFPLPVYRVFPSQPVVSGVEPPVVSRAKPPVVSEVEPLVVSGVGPHHRTEARRQNRCRL